MMKCAYDEGCLPLGSPDCLVVFCTARGALVLCWRFALYKCFLIIIIIMIMIDADDGDDNDDLSICRALKISLHSMLVVQNNGYK